MKQVILMSIMLLFITYGEEKRIICKHSMQTKKKKPINENKYWK